MNKKSGNRMQVIKTEPIVPVLTLEQTEYTYNDKKNRLLSANSDQQSAFSYDVEGQLSSVNADTYTFDYEHRLTTAALSGQQSAFSYDGRGERLKAVRNGETTYYVHDMNNNVLAETDGNKNITRYYVHGLGLIAAISPSDEVYNYHYNAIGSTVAMIDQSQNVVNKYAYDSFGKVMNQIETVPQPFKYVGQYGVMTENCELTADCLLYMRARYYDPKVGRFISEDPIGFEGGTVNLYEYVGNNPVNAIDPYGLIAVADDVAIIGLATLTAMTTAYLQSPAGQQMLNEAGKSVDEVIQEIKDWYGKRLKESKCEERTPWPGPGKKFDPNEPPDPKEPWWKKAGWAIGQIFRLLKGWPK